MTFSTRQLSLDESPALTVPGRFFATAPAFGVVAAALMLWAGPGQFAGRWSPAVLATTHLLTLGYMAMVMFGALMQVFPVVVGQRFPRSRLISTWVHLFLCVGVVLLVLGFLGAPAWVMGAAAAALALGAGLLLGAAAMALSRVSVRGRSVRSLGLALGALLLTAAFGVWLALAYVGLTPPAFAWIDDHVAWGLAGWLPLLVIAVAYQVVPMFQLTPAYPGWLMRGLGGWIFGGLVLGLVLRHVAAPAWAPALAFGLVGVGLATFAVVTLALQHRRRRRLADATVWYWQLGMVCLAVAVVLWTAGRVWAPLATDPRYPVLLGALMIPGFALAVINGMLYKIVPFLVWLHLALAPAAPGRPGAGAAPHMKQVIPPAHAKRQFRVHLAGLILLLAGIAGIPLAFEAGAASFGLGCVLLERDVLLALRLYRRRAGSGGQASPEPAGAGSL